MNQQDSEALDQIIEQARPLDGWTAFGAPRRPPRPLTAPPRTRTRDARPLLEALSEFLRRFEERWVAGKAVRGLLSDAKALRASVERALAEDDEA